MGNRPVTQEVSSLAFVPDSIQDIILASGSAVPSRAIDGWSKLNRTQNKIELTINYHHHTHGPEKLFEKNNNWMNTFEAAQYLRISENNLRVKVSRGEIPVNGKLGRIWRFRRDELDRLLESPCKKENFHD